MHQLDKIFGVKGGLGKRYNMKDLGEATFLLGLEIRRHPDGNVFLAQEKYAKDLLMKFGMIDCDFVATPLDLGVRFYANYGPTATSAGIENIGHKSTMGGLLYLTSGIRPDLAAAVNSLCRYTQ